MNELSNINKVNLNVVLNKKSENIDDYLKVLFQRKILPYIEKKMDDYDGSQQLIIDKIELNIHSLTVQNLNQINKEEELKWITFFKKEFDEKFNKAIAQIKLDSNLEIFKTYLKRGYNLNKSKSSINDVFSQLTKRELTLLHQFFIANDSKEKIVIRFIELIEDKKIDNFITSLFPNYPRLNSKINQLFNSNQSAIGLSRIHISYLMHKYFLCNNLKEDFSDEFIVKKFYESQLGLNVDFLINDEENRNVKEFNQRKLNLKNNFPDYDLVFNKVVELLREEFPLSEYNLSDLEKSFIDFIFDSGIEIKNLKHVVVKYIDSDWLNEFRKRIRILENKSEGKLLRQTNELVGFFKHLIENDSLPTLSDKYTQKIILEKLVLLARINPTELRKILLQKTNSFLWKFIQLISSTQIKKIIGFLSPKFHAEQIQFFDFIQELNADNIISFVNIQKLKKEFYWNGLENIILNKAPFFKPDKEFFIRWIAEKKIKKIKSYNAEILYPKKIPTVDVFLEVLSLKELTIKKESSTLDQFDELSQLSINFYLNTVSFILIYDEIPWWSKMQFKFRSEDYTNQVLELLSDFKRVSTSSYLNFLKTIKDSDELLKRLIFNTNQLLFDTFLIDLLPVEKKDSLQSFLKDLSKIFSSLFGHNMIYPIAQREFYFIYLNRFENESLEAFFDHIISISIDVNENNLKKLDEVSLSLKSSYFKNSFSINKLRINYKDEKLISKESHFTKFTEEFLINKLLHFIKSGELDSIFFNNNALYENLLTYILNQKMYRALLFQTISKSFFHSNYFMGSQVLLNQISTKDFEKVKSLDAKKEDSSEKNVEFKKALFNYNFTILHFLIEYNYLPSWSIYSSIIEFQQDLIRSLNENQPLANKHLTALFSEKSISDILIDSSTTATDNKITNKNNFLNEFKYFINNIWRLYELDSLLHDKANDIGLYLEISLNEKESLKLSKLFFEYAIFRISQNTSDKAVLKLNKLKDFIQKINKELKINLFTKAEIKKLISSSKKVKGEQKIREVNFKKEEKIHQSFYDFLLNNEVSFQDKAHWQPILILLLSNIKIDNKSVQQLKSIIRRLFDEDLTTQFSLEEAEKIRKQSLILFHRILVRNEFYKNQETTPINLWIDREIINKKISWLEAIDNELKEIDVEFNEQKRNYPKVVKELKAVTQELFAENEIAIHEKVLFQLYDLHQRNNLKKTDNFILGYTHYLSHVKEKQVKTILLSLYRTKSIKDSNLYHQLIGLDDEKILSEFKKQNYSTLLAFEFQQLLHVLGTKNLFLENIVYIVDFYKSFIYKNWEFKILKAITENFAIRKEIPLVKAFDQISEIVIKHKSLSKLTQLKKVFKSFEKSAYHTIEMDSFSNDIVHENNKKEIRQSNDKLVNSFINDVSSDKSYLNNLITLQETQEINKLKEELHFSNELNAIEVSSGDEIKIYNSGLALIWPFIGTLFKKLGYTIDNKFTNTENQSRAVHLLQYVIDGGNQSPEFVLVLNKLFCGVPLSDPLDLFIELSKEEKEEADQFLLSVKGKWKQMKNTSLDTFRNSFLKREGILTLQDKNWKLKVEHKPIDVLLRTLPWGFSLIKFHWIDYIIFVEWTKKN